MFWVTDYGVDLLYKYTVPKIWQFKIWSFDTNAEIDLACRSKALKQILLFHFQTFSAQTCFKQRTLFGHGIRAWFIPFLDKLVPDHSYLHQSVMIWWFIEFYLFFSLRLSPSSSRFSYTILQWILLTTRVMCPWLVDLVRHD